MNSGNFRNRALTAACIVGLAAVGVIFRRWLVFDGECVARGEIWRLWTCHFAHFGWGHFAVDAPVMAGLIFALPGFDATKTLALAAWALPVLTAAIVAVAPGNLATYGGLSGVATGLFAWFCLEQARLNRAGAWIYLALLAGLIGKTALELQAGSSISSGLFADAARPLPEAHLAALALAVVYWFIKTAYRINAGSTPRPAAMQRG